MRRNKDKHWADEPVIPYGGWSDLGRPHDASAPSIAPIGMTPELRVLLTEIRDHLRTLAEAVVTLAELDGHDQTAAKARLVASELADAVVEWEEV